MILGIGIDLADAARIRAAVTEHGESFLDTFLTEAERARCRERRDPYPCYAARFAAKEAFVKALGTGLRDGLSWRDIEVTVDAAGKPSVRVDGEAARAIERAGAGPPHLSLAHEGDTAAAVVVLETRS
jgi:holo-[acyl-carrier protein] synthase